MKRLVCPICSRRNFKNKKSLDQHIAWHERKERLEKIKELQEKKNDYAI